MSYTIVSTREDAEHTVHTVGFKRIAVAPKKKVKK